MTITTGQQALINQIAAAPGRPTIGLPNGHVPEFSDTVTSRWVIQISGGSQVGIGLDGATDARPEIMVRVETPADALAISNDTSVIQLCSLFPVGALVYAPGTVSTGVKIDKAPQPKAPMPYAGVYSVPVIITGRMFF